MNIFKNFIKKPYRLIVLFLISGLVLWSAVYYIGMNQKEHTERNWFSLFLGVKGVSLNKNTEIVTKMTGSPMVTEMVTKKMSPSNKVTGKVTVGDTIASPIMSPSSSPMKLETPTQTPLTTPKKIITPSPTSVLTPSPSSTIRPSSTFSPSPIPSPSLPLTTITPTPSISPIFETSSVVVVINEIAWMGTITSSNDEWIELYNATGNTIDLSGWTLKSTTGTNPDPVIVLSGVIQPFGYFLLERTNDSTISDITADQIYTGALSDSGETLELRDTAGNLWDKVSNAGGWYAGNKIGRFSMERIDFKQTGDNALNWKTNDGITKNGNDAGNNPINGTPRAINSSTISL